MISNPRPIVKRLSDGIERIPTAYRLILGLIILVGVGSFLLSLPMMGSKGALAPNVALFTAVSALCVTGLSLVPVGSDFSFAGQITLLVLIQMGGVGYMVLAVLVFRLLGRRIGLTERLALQDSLGLLNPKGVVDLARGVFLTVLALEGLGALALWLHWRDMVQPQDAVFFSIFHAVSAFCNAGFDLFGGNPSYPKGMPTDGVTLGILGCLIFIGGLGIPVLYDLITYWWNRRVSLHTRLTLAVSGFLMIFGAIMLFLSESGEGGVLHGLPFLNQAGFALFQSISCRTAGFVGMPSFETLNGAAQLTIVTLMFVGCAPASMGGGVTTGTFAVLVLAMIAYARGRETPILMGRAIPGEMVRKAAAVLTISLFLVITFSWVLLATHPITLDQAVFEVVSAFATCGLTLNLTPKLNGIGQAVIIFMMIWGRLGALTILFAFTKSKPPGRVRYPEEKVLIG